MFDGETFTFPMWTNRDKREITDFVPQHLEKWKSFSESVQLPLTLFTGACAEKDFSFVGAIYDNFPEAGRKNPV